ncbi:MAG: cupin domain-containing protein [Desulfobacterales bacterium]|nr:cupin domain-containing protein [Desulfobacterales bacterium]
MTNQSQDPVTVYDRSLKRQQDFIGRQRSGKMLIRSEDRPWEQNRHGLIKWYTLKEVNDDVVLQDWNVFSNRIRTLGGKHVHQGGTVIYMLAGKGYSIVDGQRFDWEAGDLIMLPIKPGGVEHQHFNLDPEHEVRWIAFSFRPFKDYLASSITQKDTSPDYRE